MAETRSWVLHVCPTCQAASTSPYERHHGTYATPECADKGHADAKPETARATGHKGHLVSTRDIVDAAGARRLTGAKQRHTLLNWRRRHDFPAPIRQLRSGVELWDAREIRAWLRARAAGTR